MKVEVVSWSVKQDGVRTSTASAPRSAARRDASMALRVDWRPVPAISTRSAGIRSRAAAISRSASSSSTRGASPFVPSTTSPCSPVPIHRSMLSRQAARSISPSSVKGVGIGANTPRKVITAAQDPRKNNFPFSAAPMHPAPRRCLLVEYCRYAPSSRAAQRAGALPYLCNGPLGIVKQRDHPHRRRPEAGIPRPTDVSGRSRFRHPDVGLGDIGGHLSRFEPHQPRPFIGSTYCAKKV